MEGPLGHSWAGHPGTCENQTRNCQSALHEQRHSVRESKDVQQPFGVFKRQAVQVSGTPELNLSEGHKNKVPPRPEKRAKLSARLGLGIVELLVRTVGLSRAVTGLGMARPCKGCG